MTEETIEIVKKTLKNHNQSHLLAFWDQLNATQKQGLINQIENIDFAQIDRWVAQYVKNSDGIAVPDDITAAPFYPPQPSDSEQKNKYAEARKLGKQLISDGKAAAFVVAGGQGTRLGFDGTKGNFPISPVKNKTLFQLFAESIAAVSEKYHADCPWYIMTSPLNDSDTREIFRSNDYYGLKKANVFMFQQGTMPNFDFEGRILLANKSTIASSPDGHGGSLKALYQSGAVEDMKKRGVEFISYFQVDNPLINIFDPLFIGLHAMENAEMSSKAVAKTEPLEKVGNFCLADGKVTVVEYSDLADSDAMRRNDDGSLVFGLGSIAIHIISREFVEKLNAKGFSLPMHRAVKKIPYVDGAGKVVEPSEPNGVKLETFVFDALPLACKSIILETLRSEEFGPVKNASGTDSAATAREMLIARAAAWLEGEAGVKVEKGADGAKKVVIEIAASFAVEKEDVGGKGGLMPEIGLNDEVYLA